MRFFIKVCVVFNSRCKDVTGIMLTDFLDAIGRVTEYLGDNADDWHFCHCVPTNTLGSYVYPHEGFVQCFREGCARIRGIKLSQHKLWKRFICNHSGKYSDDYEVMCFVDELCIQIGIT